MQIHELNTFSGTLGSSQYMAIDNGSQTTKVDVSKIGVIVVTASSVSSLSKTITNSLITAQHVVVNCVLSNPAAQTGDWTVTTSAGSLTIAGSISGTTNITLYLALQTN